MEKIESVYCVYRDSGENFLRLDHLSVCFEKETVRDVFDHFHPMAYLDVFFFDRNAARAYLDKKNAPARPEPFPISDYRRDILREESHSDADPGL